ncbi:MAG: AAA family ATPase [Arenicella sp.]
MRSILVVNPKGGSGKSTIATNLASYYAVWGVSTALVDLDPQMSSLEWLRNRPKSAPEIQGLNGLKGYIYPDRNTQRIIYDAPARSDTNKIVKLIKMTDAVLIPVLPSMIDMRVMAKFVVELKNKYAKLNKKVPIGLVANRVNKQYRSYKVLEEFLGKLGIPIVTSLRDSQSYIKAADQGIGIFEMIPSEVETDLKQWKELIYWIEGKKKDL